MQHASFVLYGLYMYGRDQNLLPVDETGAPIPLPLAADSSLPVSFIKSVPARFNGGFVQADFMVHPWIMAIMRWDAVNSTADRINGLVQANNTPFFGPVHSTRNRFTPGIQFLIHPNIKFAFEYQIRPEQAVVVTGRPFHRQVVCRQPVSSQYRAIQPRIRLLDFDIAKGANVVCHFLN
jgi:hypothetical protein